MSKSYEPVLELSKIHSALRAADKRLTGANVAKKKVHDALLHLESIIRYRIGDLVEYQREDGTWTPGVVVAYTVCPPRYICGTGNNRNRTGETLLACPTKYVRSRP